MQWPNCSRQCHQDSRQYSDVSDLIVETIQWPHCSRPCIDLFVQDDTVTSLFKMIQWPQFSRQCSDLVVQDSDIRDQDNTVTSVTSLLRQYRDHIVQDDSDFIVQGNSIKVTHCSRWYCDVIVETIEWPHYSRQYSISVTLLLKMILWCHCSRQYSDLTLQDASVTSLFKTIPWPHYSWQYCNFIVQDDTVTSSFKTIQYYSDLIVQENTVLQWPHCSICFSDLIV